jgi:hypothetical protein
MGDLDQGRLSLGVRQHRQVDRPVPGDDPLHVVARARDSRARRELRHDRAVAAELRQAVDPRGALLVKGGPPALA